MDKLWSMVWCSPAGVAAVLSLLCLLLWFLVWWRLGRRQDLEALLGREFRLHREEAAAAARLLREELAAGQSRAGKTVLAAVGELGRLQGEGLGAVEQRVRELAAANETRLERLREAVARQLQGLQENNDKKLEEMRRTVDEKLQSTLEKRLGESFRLVSERLEAVQRGLGDMRNLASGVGDLKRMLTNVKARGTWGEFQLGDILGQILTPEQYARNVQPKAGSGEIVEYAVRLPGSTAEAVVWLPIDAKFPQEDYQRLLEAAASADAEAEEKATGALLRSLQGSAREIALKYLDPPRTTDFAIMFLPTEGLYAEALRRPGLVEALQQQFRIVIAGPTTLAALLNSLRMGFRTLAIEKRSSEVWKLLAAVKTEFERFGTTLERLKKQLDTASTTIDKTGVRTRAMARVLREVEALPETEAERLLALENEGGAAEVDREGL